MIDILLARSITKTVNENGFHVSLLIIFFIDDNLIMYPWKMANRCLFLCNVTNFCRIFAISILEWPDSYPNLYVKKL